jgi:hypothetical protein
MRSMKGLLELSNPYIELDRNTCDPSFTELILAAYSLIIIEESESEGELSITIMPKSV